MAIHLPTVGMQAPKPCVVCSPVTSFFVQTLDDFCMFQKTLDFLWPLLHVHCCISAEGFYPLKDGGHDSFGGGDHGDRGG